MIFFCSLKTHGKKHSPWEWLKYRNRLLSVALYSPSLDSPKIWLEKAPINLTWHPAVLWRGRCRCITLNASNYLPVISSAKNIQHSFKIKYFTAQRMDSFFISHKSHINICGAEEFPLNIKGNLQEEWAFDKEFDCLTPDIGKTT